MRYLASFLTAALFSLTFASNTCFSQTKTLLPAPDTTTRVMMPDTIAIPGDTVLIPVKVRNFNNIGTIGLYIDYDTVALKYINLVNIHPSVIGAYHAEGGVIMFAWFALLEGLNLGNTKLFDIKFVYSSGASPFTFDLNYCDMLDINTLLPKYVEYKNGSFLGCTAPYPVADISYSGSTAICEGQSLNLYANVVSGFKYQWLKNDQYIPGATNTVFTASSEGNYQLRVENIYKCSAVSDVVTVAVEPIPQITGTSSIPICGSGSVSLNASNSGGRVYWYEVPSGGNPNASGGSYSTPVLSSNKTYYIEAVSKSCVSPQRTSVTAVVYPRPSASVTPSGTLSVCIGNTVTLAANQGQGLTYQWLKNSTVIQGATASDFTVSSSGAYSVIVTNNYDCYNSSNSVTVNINPLPNISIFAGGPASFCQGSSVPLNSSPASGLTYQWKLNNANIPSATASSYTASSGGDYVLVVSNTYNCSNSSNSVSVTVSPVPSANISASGTTTFCYGNNVLLSSNTGSGYSYQWQKDGLYLNDGTSNTYTADRSGVYSIIISNAERCSKTSNNISVTVNPVPIVSANANGATSFCQGKNVSLTASAASGLKYQWRKNNVNINGATTTAYIASSTGVYSIVETNTYQCSAQSQDISVSVNPLPAAAITGPTNLCYGEEVVYTANTGEGYTYQWLKNNVNISGATGSSYATKFGGSYSALISNAFSCSSSSNGITLSVTIPPSSSVTATGTTIFCQGNTVKLNANTGTGLTYQWQKENANITGATASSYTADLSGNFNVIVTSGLCSKSSNTVTVTVNPVPASSISANGATTFCQGNNVILSSAPASEMRYQWKLNNSNITSATASSYSANASGDYTLLITSSANCSATSNKITVTVNPVPASSITANGSTIFCQGNTVKLNANTGTGLTYQWQKDNANITGATASSYNADLTGSFNVIVTSGSCSKSSNTIAVTANPVPNSSISANGVTTFCQGNNVLLSCSPSSGNTYQWKLNNSNITSATASSYSANGSGDYTLLVTSTANCSSTSNNITVTVNPVPASSITANGSTIFCQGNTVKLNANTGTGLIYQWQKDNANISGATASSYTADLSGSFNVIVYSGSCSKSSNSIAVTVNPLPASNISANSATTFCQGSNVLLSAVSAPGNTYQWKLNNNNIASATSSSYSALASGDYFLYITNSYNCPAASNHITVTANPLPVVDLGADREIQLAGTVTLDAGAGFSSYLWSNGSSQRIITLNGSELGAGNFPFSVTVTNSYGCSASDNVIVKVLSLQTYSIDGYIKYDNTASSVLKNVKVILCTFEGVKIDSVFTDVSGHFLFSNKLNGNYTIKAKFTNKWGGVDPRDALLINRYFTNIVQIQNDLRKLAADVNLDNKVNSLDALQINRRYTQVITSFKSGDWAFISTPVTVQDANVTKTIKAVCYGDADGSYSSPSKLMTGIDIITDGYMDLKSDNEIHIPVKSATDMEIGALGLKFSVPSSQFSVIGISSDIDGLIYNINGNEIAFAYSAISEPLEIKAGQVLFNLKLKLSGIRLPASGSELLTPNSEFITIMPESIITDINSQMIPYVKLSIPGFRPQTSDFRLQIYPNPVINTANIDYAIPHDANVNISLYSLLGNKVLEIVNEYQDAGKHFVTYDFSALPAGLYIYRFEASDNLSSLVNKKFMLLSK